MPRIVQPTDESIADAAERLRAGGVVAFPTETVYGLGAATADETAVREIFRLKGRPDDNPLIAHVADAEQARLVTRGWNERCDQLAATFWPGPLTLVLGRAFAVPPAATSGLPTIAVRAPRHDVARRLLAAFGASVSAPSANRSGHVSPTRADHVADDFPDADDLLIIDGGRCAVGIESTVLDLTSEPPRVLRPGAISAPTLRSAIGDVLVEPVRQQSIAPGTSRAHYAPRTEAVLVDTPELGAWLGELRVRATVLCFEEELVPAPHRTILMPQGAGSYARELYEALRRADATGGDLIVIETPPISNEVWKAVHDRLERATTER